MIPADLTESSLLSALNGTKIAYLDGRLHETALVVAHEVIICITLLDVYQQMISPFVVYLKLHDIHVFVYC
jgi:hypothetical protein